MTKELAIIIALLAVVAGLCSISFYAGADHQKAVFARQTAKQAERQAVAEEKASDDAKSFSTEIDKGLAQDAHKTDKAVTGAKARIAALKPPVVAPAPQCGPSAYVIQVEGATPDDIWRAYAGGRNSVFQAADRGQAADLHPIDSNDIVSAAAAGSE